MFGVALGIDTADFDQLRKNPKAVLAGVGAQFILLPLLTFLLILLFSPHPAFALGMILVASCPGGNISNFFSSVSGANVSLSVTLTAVATFLSPFFTPFNFEFYAKHIPQAESFLSTFELSFFNMLKTVLILLVVPLLLGLGFRRRFPMITNRIDKPIKIISLLVLFGFIAVGLLKNLDAFIEHIHLVFLLVFLHNTVALFSGYLTGKSMGLQENLTRTITIETGIQNSGLGLIIIFNFFDGNGAMAMIAAWWGIWHIISGLTLSYFLRFRDKRVIERTLS
jgi:BASS family bile acid:Na+ symporter